MLTISRTSRDTIPSPPPDLPDSQAETEALSWNFREPARASAGLLPEGWVAHQDPGSGAFYYIHLTTRHAQWEFPKGPSALNPKPRPPVVSSTDPTPKPVRSDATTQEFPKVPGSGDGVDEEDGELPEPLSPIQEASNDFIVHPSAFRQSIIAASRIETLESDDDIGATEAIGTTTTLPRLGRPASSNDGHDLDLYDPGELERPQDPPGPFQKSSVEASWMDDGYPLPPPENSSNIVKAPSAENEPESSKEHIPELADDHETLRSMARRKKGAQPEIQKCTFPDCNKEFKRPVDLTKHIKTHTRPFKCPEASCKYATEGWPTEKERDRHVNDKHTTPTPMYACQFPECPYRSKRESNVQQHMVKVHDLDYVPSMSSNRRDWDYPVDIVEERAGMQGSATPASRDLEAGISANLWTDQAMRNPGNDDESSTDALTSKHQNHLDPDIVRSTAEQVIRSLQSTSLATPDPSPSIEKDSLERRGPQTVQEAVDDAFGPISQLDPELVEQVTQQVIRNLQNSNLAMPAPAEQAPSIDEGNVPPPPDNSIEPDMEGSSLAGPSALQQRHSIYSRTPDGAPIKSPLSQETTPFIFSSASSERHKCPYCPADFARQHNLESHLLTHSQEKPYVCQTCQARFRRLHDLKRHTKLHTGDGRPHVCDKCGRRFARGDALARHTKGPGGCAGRRPSFDIGDGDGGLIYEGVDGVEYQGKENEGAGPSYSKVGISSADEEQGTPEPESGLVPGRVISSSQTKSSKRRGWSTDITGDQTSSDSDASDTTPVLAQGK